MSQESNADNDRSRREAVRRAFGALPGLEFEPGEVDLEHDWTARVGWEGLSEPEAAAIHRDRASRSSQSDMDRLWRVIGLAVAEHPDLADVHARLKVTYLLNGIPTQTLHLDSADGGTIFINSASIDFTRHMALALTSWSLSAKDGDAGGWGTAHALMRRLISFEGWSIAHGQLWQPVQVIAPPKVAGMAELAATWSTLFWMSHEFAHAVRAQIPRSGAPPMNPNLSFVLDRSDPDEEESICDRFAFAVTVAATEVLDYWPDGARHSYYMNVCFLAQAFAEYRYFVRYGRGPNAMTDRWGAIHQWTRRMRYISERGGADEAHAAASAYYRELAHGTDVALAEGQLLDLVDRSSFATVDASQDRPGTREEIAELDEWTRLHAAPSRCVQHAVVRVAGHNPNPSMRELLQVISDSGDPPYDEGLESREFFGRVEHFRQFLVSLVGELTSTQHGAVLNPDGLTTYRQWWESWSTLKSPYVRRVLYEVASDRYPLVQSDTRDDQSPPFLVTDYWPRNVDATE